MGRDPVADVDVVDVQGGEDVQSGGAAYGVGQVVVAHQEEDGYSRAGEPDDALGELPLMGLGGVSALVGVATEEHQVDVGVDGVGYELVVGLEEVGQSGGQARLRVRLAIVLYAYVEIRKVEDAHEPSLMDDAPAGKRRGIKG